MRRAASAASRRARDLGAKSAAGYLAAAGLSAPAGPGDGGGLDARHLSLRQVPQGEESEESRRLRGGGAGAAQPVRGGGGDAGREGVGGRDLSRPRSGQRARQRGHARFPCQARAGDRPLRASRAQGAGAGGLPEARHGRLCRRGPGKSRAAQVHSSHVPAQAAGAQARGGHRQGHHLRLGRARSQAGRRHVPHEGRHVGAAAVLGLFSGPAQARPARRGARAHRGYREHALGHRAAPGRHRARHERADHRDRQHRCRGTPHPRRRPRLCRQGDQARRDGGPRHPHRRHRGRPRHGPVRCLRHRRWAGRADARRGGDGGREDVADASP